MKQIFPLSQMPRLIMVVTLIVMLGGLFGAILYIVNTPPKINLPVVNPQVKNEVAIITDKTEYEQGEEIKITITNNLKKSIWYFSDFYSNNLKLLGHRDGEWINIPMLPLSPPPSWYIPEVYELKPHEVAVLKYAPTEKILEKFLNYSEYKMGFVYLYFNPKDSAKEIAIEAQNISYSNEFTIKEKTVIDQRCSEKVLDIGQPCQYMQKMEEVGHEFDSNTEKCVSKKMTGTCSFQTPFNSLEECQKVCEKEQIDFYFCERDEDCISIDKDCCGCSGGGSDTAINKNYENKWYADQSKICGRVNCPAVMSNDPSCFQSPACENNRCVLKDKRVKDNCDVVEKIDNNTEIKGIIAESDLDYNTLKQQCLGISGCSWQSLGGRTESYYACCPEDFNDLNNTNEQVKLRCGILID